MGGVLILYIEMNKNECDKATKILDSSSLYSKNRYRGDYDSTYFSNFFNSGKVEILNTLGNFAVY